MANGTSSSSTTPSQAGITRLLALVRDNETGNNPASVMETLEQAIGLLWSRIQAASDSFVMTKEEFALFNYYRARFTNSPVAKGAVERFWDSFRGDPSEIDGYNENSSA